MPDTARFRSAAMIAALSALAGCEALAPRPQNVAASLVDLRL